MLVQARLIPSLIPGLHPWRRRLKQGLLLAAVALVLLGIARPWWGYVEEESRGTGVDVVLCMDVSRSMLASDLKPSRIQRAKLAAFDLARMAKGDRVALVAFAGTAFLQCPLALDPEAFRQSVTALDTEVIPEAGTTLSEAIKEARRAFAEDSGASRAIVVMLGVVPKSPPPRTISRKATWVPLTAGRLITRMGVSGPPRVAQLFRLPWKICTVCGAESPR